MYSASFKAPWACALLLSAACGASSTEPSPPPEPGAPCGADLGCAGGLACLEDARFPGGYCSTTCADGVCPDGARCVDSYGAPLCLAACAADGECRAEYHCFGGVCRPGCTTDRECGASATCDATGRCTGPECARDEECPGGLRCTRGACVVPPPDGGTMALPPGAPCRASAECASEVCLPESHGGVCAVECPDRSACGFDATCSPVPLDLDGDGAADAVVAACVPGLPDGLFQAGSCRRGDECESRSCIRRQCAEACDDDGDCLPGQACLEVSHPDVAGATYRGCWYEDRVGAVQVVDVALGDLGVSTGLPSRRISMAVPNDAISVTLMAHRTGGEDIALAFLDVWDPVNTPLFDYVELTSWVDQPIRWIPLSSHEHIDMLVPNTTPDRVTFRQGRHGFTLGGLSSMAGELRTADVRLSARVKRAAAEPVAGTLTLNVFLVGVGLTPAQAATHGQLQGALTELRAIYGAVGLDVDVAEYIQVTGADATRYAIVDSSGDPASEMSGLLRLSASRTNDAVDVFLVRRIAAGAGESGGIALGIAGGIPGPPGVHGTMHSGVLVSFDSAVVGTGTQGQRVIAQIMAHELGHYLGLFHNRERLAACPAGTGPTMAMPCAPFGGEDVLSDTSRSQGANLMWYALGGADGRTYNVRLSAGQGFVFHRSPLVR